MNILTKICVVILVVLILVATPVFIHHSTMLPNFRDAYEQQRLRNEVLHMDALHKTLAAQRLMRDIETLTRNANDTAAGLQRTIQDRNAEVARLQGEVAALQGEIAKFNAKLAGLLKSHEENVARRKLLSDQLAEARTQIDKLNDVYRRTDELLKEAQAEVERLTSLGRVRLEQIVEKDQQIEALNETIAKLKSGAPAAPAGEAAPDLGAPQITGTVDTVRGDLVGIGIGAAKGVKPGMKLIIYRGAEFVAHLRIQEVDVNQAAGVVADKRLDPMPGDKVTTSLN